ncbi:hypothetical protein B0H14DRAFT_2579823 [Mycena olivaceomarginata]|nr:hypothetical protein B0H14DRAFT_2579823 [Mycena olivaceomarginata]
MLVATSVPGSESNIFADLFKSQHRLIGTNFDFIIGRLLDLLLRYSTTVLFVNQSVHGTEMEGPLARVEVLIVGGGDVNHCKGSLDRCVQDVVLVNIEGPLVRAEVLLVGGGDVNHRKGSLDRGVRDVVLVKIEGTKARTEWGRRGCERWKCREGCVRGCTRGGRDCERWECSDGWWGGGRARSTAVARGCLRCATETGGAPRTL